MKEKIANFFKKLNNSHWITAICAILIGVIFLGAMISLVARPFSTNTTYTATVKEQVFDDFYYKRKITIVLLDDGRYSLTIKDPQTKQKSTTFGDYAYGKLFTKDDSNTLHNVIWFDSQDYNYFDNTVYELKNPFKLEYEDIEFTNAGGIALLVFYVFMICMSALIATVMIVRRKEGTIVFTNKMRLIKRLKEIEQMLGISHETPVTNEAQNAQTEVPDVQE